MKWNVIMPNTRVNKTVDQREDVLLWIPSQGNKWYKY